MVQSTVNRTLILAGRAVLALATQGRLVDVDVVVIVVVVAAAAATAFHEPYGVLDELHWRAEDLVGRAVEVRVGTWVRRVGVVARNVDPERVVLWEIDESPRYRQRRGCFRSRSASAST